MWKMSSPDFRPTKVKRSKNTIITINHNGHCSFLKVIMKTFDKSGVSHQVYMFIKLIFKRWLANEVKFALPPIAHNLLSKTQMPDFTSKYVPDKIADVANIMLPSIRKVHF